MRLLVGIGFPGQRDRVVQVVEENSFAKMREREANGFYKTGILRPGNPADPDSFKVRKGKVGGWREEMDDDTQAFSEEILARYDYFDRMRKLTERRGKRESLSGQFREQ